MPATRKSAPRSRFPAWVRKGLAILAFGLVSACATPPRLPAVPSALAAMATSVIGPVRYLPTRDTSAMVEEGRSAFRKEQAWLKSTGHEGELPPVSYLAISGGGDDGAFGAGLLVGWTSTGKRPEFKLVTGISTGALIAPFAFLGADYDHVLRAVYTEVSQHDIFRSRNLLSAFFEDALADTTPLQRLVGHYVDRSLLDAIAAEYAKGRLLLVGTTNLDSLEPVIWNMTAIAASRDPRAIELFRKILIASTAIPAAFPPVMIDVEVDGVRYQEMHVDGGAMTQVFVYPPSIRLAEQSQAMGADRQRTLYIIRNARMDPDWASVRRRTLPIATRAVSSLIQTQAVGDLYRIYTTVQRDGVAFNLTFIPASFDVPHAKNFDPSYMRPLFKVGYDMAVAGRPWQDHPPGWIAPMQGPAEAERRRATSATER